jgi:hypothetical protein
MDENIYFGYKLFSIILGNTPKKNLRDLHTITRLGFTTVVRFTTHIPSEKPTINILEEPIYQERNIQYIQYQVNTDEKSRLITLQELANFL